MKTVNNNPNILFSDYDGTMSPLNLKANINAIKKFINKNLSRIYFYHLKINM